MRLHISLILLTLASCAGVEDLDKRSKEGAADDHQALSVNTEEPDQNGKSDDLKKVSILEPKTKVKDAARCPGYKKGKHNLYWGDLHVHTSYSHDAFGFGTRGDPAFAYRFAKGKESVSSILKIGEGLTKIRIDRPLDFAAVTDHAEYLAQRDSCSDRKHSNFSSAYCKEIRDRSSDGLKLGQFKSLVLAKLALRQPKLSTGLMREGWEQTVEAAQVAYDPCKFTSLIGYEWSQGTRRGVTATFHKNVIFKSDAVPNRAFDAVNFPNERDLWTSLDSHCKLKDGCEVLTIPHNTNKSKGIAFTIFDHAPSLHKLRRKYDKLVEIFQGKGESECVSLDPKDRSFDCSFEKLPLKDGEVLSQSKKGYVRGALRKGLKYEVKQGMNPLQFGFVGATDTHRANPGNVLESRWGGNHGKGDMAPAKRLKRHRNNPGGLTGVWATENRRGAIFEAMKARRVYATSGPRIAVEFFQIWDTDNIAPCKAGGPHGTLMGGVMKAPPQPGAKPIFVVRAAKDEFNLAAVDFIVGAYDSKMERPVSSVTVKKAEKEGGQASLCKVFRYADYDPKQASFVYARVREVLSPRWSKYDCQQVGECNRKQDKMIQERAWASAIWSVP